METKQLIVEIAEELHTKLKIMAAEKKTSMSQLIIEVVEKLTKKQTNQ